MLGRDGCSMITQWDDLPIHHDLVRDLTLAYNKGRQDAITKELMDITGGARAVAR